MRECESVFGVVVRIVPIASEDREYKVGHLTLLEVSIRERLGVHVADQTRDIFLIALADVVIEADRTFERGRLFKVVLLLVNENYCLG